MDGTEFDSLLDKTEESGLVPKEVFDDKAYFKPDILRRIEADGAQPYIPASAAAYRIDEGLFSYNKDSDQWFCAMGNETVSRKRRDTKRGGAKRSYLVYTFDRAICAGCPCRGECMGKAKTKARSLQVSLYTAELYEASQRQKTPEFLEKYKKRGAQEWKNGELKRFHGLAQARGFGLKGVAIQAKLTAIAVNLKRIAALAGEKDKKQGPSAELFPHMTAPRFLILPSLILQGAFAPIPADWGDFFSGFEPSSCLLSPCLNSSIYPRISRISLLPTAAKRHFFKASSLPEYSA